MIGAACSVQGGAAVAKTLFPELGPPGVVFLRLLFGALALWAIARPQIRGRSRADLQLVVALGVVLVSMNMCFYEAIARLPLGIAVTVEFLGPLASPSLARAGRSTSSGSRSPAAASRCSPTAAATSVSTTGIVLAAAAGVFWALYILLSVRVGRRWPGPTGLAPAMVVGGAARAAVGDHQRRAAISRDAQLVGAAVGVGLLSSALPWSMELEALRRLPPRVFSVVLSLEPAVAALARRRLPARASAHAVVGRDRAGRARERGRRTATAPDAAAGSLGRLDVLVDAERRSPGRTAP